MTVRHASPENSNTFFQRPEKFSQRAENAFSLLSWKSFSLKLEKLQKSRKTFRTFKNFSQKGQKSPGSNNSCSWKLCPETKCMTTYLLYRWNVLKLRNAKFNTSPHFFNVKRLIICWNFWAPNDLESMSGICSLDLKYASLSLCSLNHFQIHFSLLSTCFVLCYILGSIFLPWTPHTK